VEKWGEVGKSVESGKSLSALGGLVGATCKYAYNDDLCG